jgi:beta-lactam-binding protein with PASTA domain
MPAQPSPTASVYSAPTPALPTIPAVLGLKLGKAKDALAEAGFKWKVEKQVSATEPAGTVISQSIIAGAGAELGTRITLTIAEHPTVPNVVGEKLGNAKDILADAGYKWTVERVVSSEPVNTVLGQSARAGAKAKGGTRIVLTVAKAAAAPPPPAKNCHPSYEGACLLPNASDYDCTGGSGNGPYYTGFVYVVGPDVFGLDADNDGLGCE